jgi:hypothetical protein
MLQLVVHDLETGTFHIILMSVIVCGGYGFPGVRWKKSLLENRHPNT